MSVCVFVCMFGDMCVCVYVESFVCKHSSSREAYRDLLLGLWIPYIEYKIPIVFSTGQEFI